jgi:hypothetical protein
MCEQERGITVPSNEDSMTDRQSHLSRHSVVSKAFVNRESTPIFHAITAAQITEIHTKRTLYLL